MRLSKYIIGLLLICFTISIRANEKFVETNDELTTAIKEAQPGDTIILANKTWTDAIIKFYAKGEATKPIVIKAQEAGKVILTGNSRIIISGEHLVVEGLHFTNGSSINKPVISLKRNNEEITKFCRVTNCAITNYNPPSRSDKYNWVELWGKNNRIDHNSFYGKTNVGPVLVVLLKGNEESSNNNHRIDNLALSC